MRLPPELVEIGCADDGFAVGGRGRIATERRADAVTELLLHQDALGGNGPRPAKSKESGDRGQQMAVQNDENFHGKEA
jgi:hypothetical protein